MITNRASSAITRTIRGVTVSIISRPLRCGISSVWRSRCRRLLLSKHWNTALDEYQHALLTEYGVLMRRKLGFVSQQQGDNLLLDGLFSLMAREGSDYTRTFRMLSLTEQHSASSPLRDEFIDRAAFDRWFTDYRARLRGRKTLMMHSGNN